MEYRRRRRHHDERLADEHRDRQSGHRISSQGITVTAAGATGNTFTNNTVTGNGVGIASGFVQSPGVVLRNSAASTTLDRKHHQRQLRRRRAGEQRLNWHARSRGTPSP